MAQEEFKFPDELPEVQIGDSGDDIKVDIVDDTPSDDRGRTPLPQNLVEELEKDDLTEYSEKVKQRLSQMKKVWHDERREKERVAREREEALAFAQHTYEENKRLKERLGTGEKIFINEITKSATTEVGAVKEALQRAYESGDPKVIAEAQEMLIDAKAKLKEAQNFKPTPLQDSDYAVQTQQRTQQAPRVERDDKAESWRDRNSWFGSDAEMTSLALGTHERLVRAGYDPRSDEYYRQIDLTMRKRFPEQFEGEPTQPTTQEKPAARKPSTVVASVTRSTAPRQIRLTSSEAAIAKSLGLTPEAYAREKIKLENNNG
jgi:hypothetical protein